MTEVGGQKSQQMHLSEYANDPSSSRVLVKKSNHQGVWRGDPVSSVLDPKPDGFGFESHSEHLSHCVISVSRKNTHSCFRSTKPFL